MCRLLLIKSREEFWTEYFLKNFAHISKHSKEYQGHGWGCSFLRNGRWEHYKDIKPIWKDNLSKFGKTSLLVAHARSAFENKDIRVENNMPFYDGRYVFIFNGELRGVRISEQGRIGAEKIFNFIKRFDKGDMEFALKKGVELIRKKSRYVKSMNIILATKDEIFLNSFYSEDEDYFSMHLKNKSSLIICSEPFPDEEGWSKIPNNTVMAWR